VIVHRTRETEGAHVSLKTHLLGDATVLESDDVIDPAETRQWILRLLDAAPNSEPIREGRRPYIDSW